ncbi:hfq family protein [Leptospira interrogans serovar Pomona str. CSL10083]|nr:hfq family protein [Leptospira interrogans serovar Pomona str. CSL10083]
MKGKVVSFDNFTIVLEQENKQSLVYKHAISTIIPAKIIKLYTEEAKDNKDAAQG